MATRAGGRNFEYGDPFSYYEGAGMAQKGADRLYELPITLREAAFGVEKTFTLPSDKKTEKLSVKIPGRDYHRQKTAHGR